MVCDILGQQGEGADVAVEDFDAGGFKFFVDGVEFVVIQPTVFGVVGVVDGDVEAAAEEIAFEFVTQGLRATGAPEPSGFVAEVMVIPLDGAKDGTGSVVGCSLIQRESERGAGGAGGFEPGDFGVQSWGEVAGGDGLFEFACCGGGEAGEV